MAKEDIMTKEQLLAKINQLENKITRLENVELKSQIWLDASPVCTKIIDLDFNLQYISSAGIRELKIDDISEFYGKPYPFSFYPDSFKIPMAENLKEVKETGKTIIHEAFVHDINGNEIWYNSSINPVCDDNGKLDSIMIISTKVNALKQAELALRESEERFRQMFNSHSAIMLLIDPETGTILDSNLSAQNFYAYSDESLKQMTVQDLNTLPKEKVIELHKQAQKENHNYFVFPHRIASGEIRTVEVHSSPIIVKNKQILFSIIHDITERNKAEQALQESKEKLNRSQKIGKIGHWEFNLNTRELKWSDQVFTLYERDIKLGQPTEKESGLYYSKEDNKRLRGYVAQIIETCKPYENFECPIFLPSGRIIITIGSMFPIMDNNGTVIKIFGVLQDITERKQAEKNLQNTFDISPSIIAKIDSNTGYFIEVNHAVTRILGYSIEEFTSKPLIEFIHLDDRQETIKEILSLSQGKEINISENRYKCKDGSYKWISWNATKTDNNGIIITTGSDISESKIAEVQLIESEEKYRTIIETSNDMIWMIDSKGHFTFLNAQTEKASGYLLKDIKGKSFHDFVIEDELPFLNEVYTKTMSGESITYEMSLKTTYGNILTLAVNTAPLFRDEEIHGMLSFARDITHQKEAENNVLKLSTAVQQSPVMLVITDTKGDIEYINPRFSEITGYTNSEAIGQKSNILKSGEHAPSHYKEMWETIDSGKIWRGQFHNKKKNGELFWESASISAILNEAGEVINFLKIGEDITQQKKTEAELKIALEKSLESDRLKSAFLSNMSHEIRTPMNGILGFMDLLDDPNLSRSEINSFSNIIKRNSDRLLNTISNIIDLSRIEAGEVLISNTETSVQTVMNDIYKSHSSEAEIEGLSLLLESSPSHEQINIITDSHKLTLILTKLVNNAIKYTKIGSITLGYSLKDKHIEFFVKDTGIGIPEDRIKAIYNCFEQADIGSKRAYEGSGLGLAISKAYIEMLGGKIWVESELGKGSTFYFTLPYTKEVNK